MNRWARLAALAASLGGAGCQADGGAVTGALAPIGAPRAAAARTGPPRAVAATRTLEQDHADLVGAFGGEVRSASLGPILSAVAADLVAHSEAPDERVTVTVLDSPKVNAFSLPSGRLYVTRGLLALASDPDEVAAVLAHEMAHVIRRHAQSRIEQEARSALVSRVSAELLGSGQDRSAALAQRSRASLASFSRAQELEADALGIATLAAAGYDPGAAARFLAKLGRQAAFDQRETGDPDEVGAMMSTHPATTERIALAAATARRLGATTSARTGGRERWLAALDGTIYGEAPADGLVRGRSFIQPRLGIAFEAPAGVALENTPRAVLGANRDGTLRLLFDAVEAPAEQPLGELLAASWSDPVDAGGVASVPVNGRDVAVASSRGESWTFRLAAVRVGTRAYRLVLAARGAAVRRLDPDRDGVLASIRAVSAEEAAALRPQRIAIVTAAPGDTPATLAARMPGTAPLERFLILNGLDRGAALTPGERYKVVGE